MATEATPITDAIRTQIEADVRALYEAKFAKEIADHKQKMDDENNLALTQAIDEFKKSQQPPTAEDISKLLSQDYLHFTVKVTGEDENGKEIEREFTIKELPQSVEKKFYREFKEKLLPRASDLGALTFELVGGDVGDKIKSLLETFEPTFDLMAAACKMILDPRDRDKTLTKDWIQDNLSSYRQWNIIYAQIEVNRLRDFFSQLSRGSSGAKTNLGVLTRS